MGLPPQNSPMWRPPDNNIIKLTPSSQNHGDLSILGLRGSAIQRFWGNKLVSSKRSWANLRSYVSEARPGGDVDIRINIDVEDGLESSILQSQLKQLNRDRKLSICTSLASLPFWLPRPLSPQLWIRLHRTPRARSPALSTAVVCEIQISSSTTSS